MDNMENLPVKQLQARKLRSKLIILLLIAFFILTFGLKFFPLSSPPAVSNPINTQKTSTFFKKFRNVFGSLLFLNYSLTIKLSKSSNRSEFLVPSKVIKVQSLESSLRSPPQFMLKRFKNFAQSLQAYKFNEDPALKQLLQAIIDSFKMLTTFQESDTLKKLNQSLVSEPEATQIKVSINLDGFQKLILFSKTASEILEYRLDLDKQLQKQINLLLEFLQEFIQSDAITWKRATIWTLLKTWKTELEREEERIIKLAKKNKKLLLEP